MNVHRGRFRVSEDTAQYLIDNASYFRKMALFPLISLLAASLYFRGLGGIQYFNSYNFTLLCLRMTWIIHGRAVELINGLPPVVEYNPEDISCMYLLAALIASICLLLNPFTLGVPIAFITECILAAPVAMYISWKQEEIAQNAARGG